MIIVFISGLSVGYGLAYTNNVLDIINAVFGWDNSAALYDSLYSSIFALGAAVGCSSAGKLIQYGRRRAHFIAGGIGIVGVGLQCFETLPTLFIGRLIYGFTTGLVSVATTRMVDEYVPL